MIDKTNLLDVNNATHKELLSEYNSCQKDWGNWSCDSYGYYIQALHKAILKTGKGFNLTLNSRIANFKQINMKK